MVLFQEFLIYSTIITIIIYKLKKLNYTCQKRDENVNYNNYLIPIKTEDLKYKNLSQIVNNKISLLLHSFNS